MTRGGCRYVLSQIDFSSSFAMKRKGVMKHEIARFLTLP